MEGAYAFTCQLCRARLTLVGSLEAAPGAESSAWAGGRGLLVSPHLQASVFDHTNVDESFIVLDGRRQGPQPHLQPTGPHSSPHLHSPPKPPSAQQPPASSQPAGHHAAGTAAAAPPPLPPPGTAPPLPPAALLPPRAGGAGGAAGAGAAGMEESFVMLGAASVLRPPHPYTHAQAHALPHHPAPPGVSPLHMQALQQQQTQQAPSRLGPGAGAAPGQGPGLAPAGQGPGGAGAGPGIAAGAGGGVAAAAALPPSRLAAGAGGGGVAPAAGPAPRPHPQQQGSPPAPPLGHPQQQSQAPAPPSSQQQSLPAQGSPPPPSALPPLPPPSMAAAAAPGAGAGTAAAQRRGGSVDSDAATGGGGGGGGGGGSGLDAKLQSLAALFELASTATQVDHPLCMDCVGQLKEEMEAQISEAEREIAAYSACLAQLEGASAGGGGGGGAEGAAGCMLGGVGGGGWGGARRDSEEWSLEEISRLEQERDQERARAEVLEAELSALASELSSLASASADLASLEERHWHDANEVELLLRTHTDERGALLARIDRAGQRLTLLKNTSVLYDAFKIWHDGPFGTISGFRLGRTPEVAVEWDEINAAWGQAVLLLHTMAQMCKLQFSSHRLIPMGSHPRVADKRSTYDLFGPVSKLWSANYDRAMVAYLACLKEFGEHARRRDVAEGRPVPFSFPFPIDGDKVNAATIKLTLNKDSRWTKALKFMLANLKVALQWCVKQDSAGEAAPLQALAQEGPAPAQEH